MQITQVAILLCNIQQYSTAEDNLTRINKTELYHGNLEATITVHPSKSCHMQFLTNYVQKGNEKTPQYCNVQAC